MNNNTIIIKGTTNQTIIQQGNQNSVQSINIESLDYNKILQTLNKIKTYTSTDEFANEFDITAEDFKNLLDKTIALVKEKEEPSKLKSYIEKLKNSCSDIATGVISSGIYALLSQLS